jgi:hypothetical protein
MFYYTFASFASNSPTATIPPGLFDKIDTSKGTDFGAMFAYTFSNYATRQATFKLTSGTTAETQSFLSPYSTKIGTTGTPSTNPTVTVGNQIYPTYTATTRTITAPAGNYLWSTKDGTSCEITDPTPDCGTQDPSTLVTFPSSTYWTPTTPTDFGNVTFYQAPPYITISTPSTIKLLITPTPAGITNRATHTVTVSTNNPSGYNLSLSIAKDTSTQTCTATNALIHTTTPTSTIPSTTNPWITAGNANTALTTNTWGFNLNSSTDYFMQIPNCYAIPHRRLHRHHLRRKRKSLHPRWHLHHYHTLYRHSQLILTPPENRDKKPSSPIPISGKEVLGEREKRGPTPIRKKEVRPPSE